MATIERGEEYIYDDFVDNIVEILNQNLVTLGVNYVGTFDDFLVPTYPSIYVFFDSAEEEWVHLPRVKYITIRVQLHYYHRNLNQEVKKDEIDEALGKIAKIIRQNHSCNGFLDTEEGMTIESVDALGELRGEYGGVGDGLIMITGVKRIRVQNIT